jgi:hypothetical protein
MWSKKMREDAPIAGDDRNMGTMAFDALKRVKRGQLLNSTSKDSPDVRGMVDRGNQYYQDQNGREANGAGGIQDLFSRD